MAAEFHFMLSLITFGCDWFAYSSPPLPILSNYVLNSIEDFIDLD